jgi:hypothetical protein
MPDPATRSLTDCRCRRCRSSATSWPTADDPRRYIAWPRESHEVVTESSRE